jgi:hypothetical protein
MLFWDCLVWGCFTNIAILTNREGAKGAKEEEEEELLVQVQLH